MYLCSLSVLQHPPQTRTRQFTAALFAVLVLSVQFDFLTAHGFPHSVTALGHAFASVCVFESAMMSAHTIWLFSDSFSLHGVLQSLCTINLFHLTSMRWQRQGINKAEADQHTIFHSFPKTLSTKLCIQWRREVQKSGDGEREVLRKKKEPQ